LAVQIQTTPNSNERLVQRETRKERRR